MRIGVPKEVHPGERRVAVTPQTAEKLQKLGFEVVIESGAGAKANYSDAAYAETGVHLVDDAQALWVESDVILKVRPPGANETIGMYEADLLRTGSVLIVNVPSLEDAQNFSENEPFRKNGLFSRVEINRMRRGQWNPSAAPQTAEGN